MVSLERRSGQRRPHELLGWLRIRELVPDGGEPHLRALRPARRSVRPQRALQQLLPGAGLPRQRRLGIQGPLLLPGPDRGRSRPLQRPDGRLQLVLDRPDPRDVRMDSPLDQPADDLRVHVVGHSGDAFRFQLVNPLTKRWQAALREASIEDNVMRKHLWRTFAVPLAVALSAVVVGMLGSASADDGHCAHCGRRCACQKVCRLVWEEKKVEVTCWGCKCEDFGVPGPSHAGCRHCDEVCSSCDAADNPQGVCAKPKKFSWIEWIPGCAKVQTRTKLMRKVVVRKVPGYKWVVEDLCEHCEAGCGCADIQPGVEVPPPPAVDAKLKYGASAAAQL